MIITRTGIVMDAERRSGMLAGWPNGYGLMDPAAIPPPGMYSTQRAGVPVNLKTALQVDAVQIACRVITNALTSLGDPLAYEVGLSDENLPYRKYLAVQPAVLSDTWGPNVFQFDGMTRTIMCLILFMEAFWYVLERDRLGYPTCLEVLNPAIVDMKKDGTVWYGTGRDKVQLDLDDLIHIPFIALPGAQRGLNPIEYAGANLAVALAALEYGQRWFAQGASPSFILSTEQKLGQAEVQRIAEKFLIEHSGLQSAHLPLVVDSGLKVERVSSSPDEAQYLQTLNTSRAVIAAYFGLPSHLVGGTDASTAWGGTMEQQGIQMTLFTLSGYITRLNEAFSSLLPKPIKAGLLTSQLKTPDATSLAKLLQMARLTGTLTANELRSGYFDKGPREGGDALISPLNSNTSPFVGGVFAEEVADDLDLPNPSPAAAPVAAGPSSASTDATANAGS